MNWLAKISFKTMIRRFGPYRSTLLLLLIVGICLYGGYRTGNYYHGHQIKTLNAQKQRLNDLYHQQNEQTRRINTLEVELEVERLANQKSLTILKEMENSHYEVKKELAFYEKVMAPEKQADGLAIDNATFVTTESPDHYRFQVVLVQQRLKKRYAKGYVELIFVGSLNNKPSKIKLTDITTLTKKDLGFSFQYFQLIDGEFTLPKGFIVEQVNVSAILQKSKWQKYHKLDKTYSWPIEPAQNSLIEEKLIKEIIVPYKDKEVILD
ncbi:MAG: hypothetical protein MJK12_04945 [Colwellia sp.]|nr:hypothetical protein [Colwellia sp.]